MPPVTEQAILEVQAQLDRAIGELKELEGGIEKTGKSSQRSNALMKDLALTIGALVSARALFSFLADSTRLWRQQAEAVAQVEAALESTGGAAGKTSKELQQAAADFQDATNFGDEEILKAQSVLLTFTNIVGDNFDLATGAVLNMAERLGTDLTSASIQVGKALNDPIQGVTALGRAGVQFTEDQKKSIKTLVETNRVYEAQAIILSELETQFGGAAAAAVRADGGVQQFKNQLGDIQESIGKGILPALRNVISDLSEVGTTGESTAEKFGRGFGAILETLRGVARQGDLIFNGFRGIGTLFVRLFETVATGLSDLLKRLPDFIPGVDKITQGLDQAAKNAQDLADRWEQTFRAENREAAEQLAESLGEINRIGLGLKPAMDDAAGATAGQGAAAAAAAEANKLLGEELKKTGDKAKAAAQVTIKALEEQQEAVEALGPSGRFGPRPEGADDELEELRSLSTLTAEQRERLQELEDAQADVVDGGEAITEMMGGMGEVIEDTRGKGLGFFADVGEVASEFGDAIRENALPALEAIGDTEVPENIQRINENLGEGAEIVDEYSGLVENAYTGVNQLGIQLNAAAKEGDNLDEVMAGFASRSGGVATGLDDVAQSTGGAAKQQDKLGDELNETEKLWKRNEDAFSTYKKIVMTGLGEIQAECKKTNECIAELAS